MLDVATDLERGLFLLVLSLACLVAGHAYRKWPDRMAVFSAMLDGSAFFFGPEAYLRIVRLSGLGLITLSYVTLVAAAILI